MTASIQDQLRDYAVQVISQSMSVDVDEIVSGDVFSEPVTQTVGAWPEYPAEPIVSTRRRGWLVAVATAVAMLVVVGGASLLFRVTGPGTPVATTPPTTPQSLGTWSRVPHDDAVFGGGLPIPQRDIDSRRVCGSGDRRPHSGVSLTSAHRSRHRKNSPA